MGFNMSKPQYYNETRRGRGLGKCQRTMYCALKTHNTWTSGTLATIENAITTGRDLDRVIGVSNIPHFLPNSTGIRLT